MFSQRSHALGMLSPLPTRGVSEPLSQAGCYPAQACPVLTQGSADTPTPKPISLLCGVFETSPQLPNCTGGPLLAPTCPALPSSSGFHGASSSSPSSSSHGRQGALKDTAFIKIGKMGHTPRIRSCEGTRACSVVPWCAEAACLHWGMAISSLYSSTRLSGRLSALQMSR